MSDGPKPRVPEWAKIPGVLLKGHGSRQYVEYEEHKRCVEMAETEVAAERDSLQANLTELLSAYKVWKNATESRCRLLSSREASDTMLFPDRAFIAAADQIAKTVGGSDG